MHGNTKYTPYAIDILLLNYNNMNNDELSLLLGISKSKVRYLMDKLKLKRTNHISCPPYKKRNSNTCKHITPLLEDSLTVFYWIGFILADGWIRKASSGRHMYYQLGVELSMKDYTHLCKLANFLGVKCTTSTRNTNFKSNYDMCRVGVTNFPTIPKIMEKFDIKFNKTTNPPNPHNYNFTDEQLLAMFIGFIDGDGSISRRVKKTTEQTILSIQNRAEWFEWLEFMLCLVKRNFDTDSKVKVRMNSRNHAYLCLTKHNVLLQIKDFAVSNSLPILERKWDAIVAYTH